MSPRSRLLPPRAALLAALFASCASPAAADSTATTTLALPPVAVSGYVQLDYRRAFNGGLRHDFAVRRARLTLSGKAHERVGFNLTIQGDRPGASSVAVLDAYADVALVRGWTLRAGQNKYEFDIEGREADDRNPVIDRSWASNAVAGGMLGTSTASSGAGSFRDRGVGVFGRTPFAGFEWGWAAGVYQGYGREIDRDHDVGYTLRARVQRSGLTLNYGWMSSPVERPSEDYLYSAWTAGIDHIWRWHHLRAEVYEGQLDYGGRDYETQGGYVLEIVRVHAVLDLSARWQTLVVDGFLDDHGWAADAGARVWFTRGDVRTNTWFALDYMVRDAGAAIANQLTLLNDGAGFSGFPADKRRGLLIARLQVTF